MSRKRLFACLSPCMVFLLIAAWIANSYGQLGLGIRCGAFDYHFRFISGCFHAGQYDNNFMKQGLFWRTRLPPVPEEGDLPYHPLAARLEFHSASPGRWDLYVPIFLLITAMIPFVVGSFSGFRFHLWQYFAFTALFAVALAYSLR